MLSRVTSITPRPKEARRPLVLRIIAQKDKFNRHKTNNKMFNSQIQKGNYLEIAKVQKENPQ